MAPPAAQRAPLEKHGGTDAGTVKDGKFFDIKDCTLKHYR
jgi:hypothetical protein